MEFNETSSISSLLLSKSILKVSDDKIMFSLKDTARYVRAVLFYWGSFLVEGDPSNENVGPSSLENENGGENRSSFFVLVGRKERPKVWWVPLGQDFSKSWSAIDLDACSPIRMHSDAICSGRSVSIAAQHHEQQQRQWKLFDQTGNSLMNLFIFRFGS